MSELLNFFLLVCNHCKIARLHNFKTKWNSLWIRIVVTSRGRSFWNFKPKSEGIYPTGTIQIREIETTGKINIRERERDWYIYINNIRMVVCREMLFGPAKQDIKKKTGNRAGFVEIRINRLLKYKGNNKICTEFYYSRVRPTPCNPILHL